MTCIFAMQNLVSYFLFSYCVIFYYFASILFAISLTCSILLLFFLFLSVSLSVSLPFSLPYSFIHSFTPPPDVCVVHWSTCSPAPLWLPPLLPPFFSCFHISLIFPSFDLVSMLMRIFWIQLSGDSNRYSFWFLIHWDGWLRYPIVDD